MALTNDERLALLVAIDKTVSPVLKEAKSELCTALVSQAEAGEADRKPVMVNGQKVGEIGVSYSKAAPVIIDEVEAIRFLDSVGLTVLQPMKGWEQFFVPAGEAVVYKPTGEVVPGMQWEGQRPKSAAVRIKDAQTVLDAFGNRLAGQDLSTLLLSGDSLLLEAGE